MPSSLQPFIVKVEPSNQATHYPPKLALVALSRTLYAASALALYPPIFIAFTLNMRTLAYSSSEEVLMIPRGTRIRDSIHEAIPWHDVATQQRSDRTRCTSNTKIALIINLNRLYYENN